MTNPDERLTQAREGLQKARTELLDSCLDKIRSMYVLLPPDKGELLIGKLELLIAKTGGSKSSPGIENARAVMTREKAGLSRKDLAAQLGISEKQLSRYEASNRFWNGEHYQNYLEWLKANSY